MSRNLEFGLGISKLQGHNFCGISREVPTLVLSGISQEELTNLKTAGIFSTNYVFQLHTIRGYFLQSTYVLQLHTIRPSLSPVPCLRKQGKCSFQASKSSQILKLSWRFCLHYTPMYLQLPSQLNKTEFGLSKRLQLQQTLLHQHQRAFLSSTGCIPLFLK